MAGDMHCQPFGESALLVTWPALQTESVRDQIHRVAQRIHDDDVRPPMFAVPGFASLTIHFDPLKQSFDHVVQKLHEASVLVPHTKSVDTHVVNVPICFDSDCAIDAEVVSSITGLEFAEVVRRFCDAALVVQMIGFAPGFPYLAGLPLELHVPRRATPRLKIAAGSVAIGGSQAGIYPTESPGGWNIIGRTPLSLFAPERDPCCLLQPGDTVRFDPISRADFERLKVAR